MDRNYIGYAVLTIAYEYAQYFHHGSINGSENVDNNAIAATEIEETNTVNVSERVT